MKTLKNLVLAVLAVSLLAIPLAASSGKGGQRSNNGSAKLQGQARAEQVRATSKKVHKEASPSKGSKSKGKKTREGWEKKAKHNAKGHS